MHLELLPAVDVASGKAVRLTQGEAGSEEDFGHPLSQMEKLTLSWRILCGTLTTRKPAHGHGHGHGRWEAKK